MCTQQAYVKLAMIMQWTLSNNTGINGLLNAHTCSKSYYVRTWQILRIHRKFAIIERVIYWIGLSEWWWRGQHPNFSLAPPLQHIQYQIRTQTSSPMFGNCIIEGHKRQNNHHVLAKELPTVSWCNKGIPFFDVQQHYNVPGRIINSTTNP